MTGIARDVYDGALLGFFVNDSGTGLSAQFLSCQATLAPQAPGTSPV